MVGKAWYMAIQFKWMVKDRCKLQFRWDSPRDKKNVAGRILGLRYHHRFKEEARKEKVAHEEKVKKFITEQLVVHES